MNTNTLLFPLLFTLCLSAMNAWGICYDQTQGSEINFNNCRTAAEQNDATAQYFLGQMYRKGEGVDKNAGEALRWYRKAAEQGNAPAQYNLGWMYDAGEGVAQDVSEAVKWYRKAAENGDKYAPFNLGVMYYTGSVVPKDPVNTHFWFDIAILNGNEKGAKWRNKIAPKMSPEQIAEAKQLVDDWQGNSVEVEDSTSGPLPWTEPNSPPAYHR